MNKVVGSEMPKDPGAYGFIADAIPVTTYAECVEAYLAADDLHVLVLEQMAPYTGGVLPWVDGHAHHVERRLASRLVTQGQLVEYEEGLLQPEIDRCLAEAAAKRSEDGLIRIDLREFAETVLIRVSARITGLDGTDDPVRAAALLEYHDAILEAMTGRWSTLPFEELDRRGKQAKDDFARDFYEPSLARRKQLVESSVNSAGGDSSPPLDLLTLMLTHPDEDWDEELTLRASIVFLIASVSSTASSIVHLVDETIDWFGKHPEDRVHLDDDTFVRGLINEALRLHPVTPAQVRRAVRSAELPSGRVVEEGQILALMTGAANTDVDVFGEDAAEFDPRRWERLPKSVPPFGLTFGYGVHLCVGKPLVTTAAEPKRGGENVIQRANMRIFRALLAAGIERDAGLVPTAAQSHMDRHDTYPVVLARL